MAALLKVNIVQIPDHDYGEREHIKPSSTMLILADIRKFNPEIQHGGHEYVYNVPTTKAFAIEHEVYINPNWKENFDKMSEDQIIHTELPHVLITNKDGSVDELFFFNFIDAQNFLDALEKELNDFYENYGSYVASVQKA